MFSVTSRIRVFSLAEDPLVLQLQLLRRRLYTCRWCRFIITKRLAFQILLAKLRMASHFLHIEAHIVAGAVAGDQVEAQGVGAVLLRHLQRVDAVAQGLGHLAALVIPHQAVDQHGVEGHLASSARMPEKIMRATQKKMIS